MKKVLGKIWHLIAAPCALYCGWRLLSAARAYGDFDPIERWLLGAWVIVAAVGSCLDSLLKALPD